VVTFDAAEPGTLAALWHRDARMSDLPALDLDGVARLVVVAAHPDDESLGAGALVAEAAALGIAVSVVVVTDGAASHPDSPTTTPDELRRLRAAEARLAVHRLSPDAVVHLLGFADGEVAQHRPAIRAAIADLLPDGPVLLVAPWRGDGHADHTVVGEVCAELALAPQVDLLEYPIWLWHWAAPDDAEVPWQRLVSLAPQGEALARKRNAIEAYASQAEPLSDQPGDEAMLLEPFLENFRGPRELFVRDLPAAAPVDDEDVSASEADRANPLGAHYFDDIYDRADDPWGFTNRWYEERKRAVTLASLPEARYRSALEVGCSIGVLTEQLATRCDSVLAVDVSGAAVERARERVASEPGVRVELADVASGFPAGEFDLVLLSEVGYYFEPDVLRRVLAGTAASLAEGGTVVLCHWRHGVADYALRGDEVHDIAAQSFAGDLVRLARHEEHDFVLDVYSRDARSVAARTGLL
jgi:LmbE family N-acetylglucosaminyl deacetylase